MTSTETLRRTPLYSLHKQLGAKLVDFHGWELPIQFESILKEHQAVRAHAGLFDVSHMGQITAEGPRALDFVQRVNSNDAARLKAGEAMYSHLLNARGGVIDDVIVTRLAKDRFFIVVNAATADKDFAWFESQAGEGVELANRSAEYGMLALQGPKAEAILAQLLPQSAALKRFGALETLLYGHPVVVTRTGYTGEDGFEIVVPEIILVRVWENLMVGGGSLGLTPCGLGARDTLRLEAGYLLYGQDIDEEHSPLEANYAWVVKFDKKDFIGKEALERQLKAGLSRRLFGVKLSAAGVPRSGCPVYWGDKPAGKLTSATFSPTFHTGIGIGYLARDLRSGAKVSVEIHGRRAEGEIVDLPFYKRG